MRLYLGILLALASITFSCQKQKTIDHSINGVWESLGYGWFLEIKDSSSYSFYDITSISCLPVSTSELKDLDGAITLNEDTLSVLVGVATYKFKRAEKLPALCTQTLTEEKAKDPLYNFDVFSKTVEEHYAFLELNKINWAKLYAEQRGKLSQRSTDAELYLLLEETLEKLNDQHGFLEATTAVDEAVDKILDQEEENSEAEDLPEYGDFQVAEMVAKHYLQEEMTEDSWLVSWGKMKDNIGFIQLKSMWLHGDLDIPKALIEDLGYVDAYVETFHKMYEGDYVQKEVAGIRKTMSKVMQDLSEVEAMIIDVRFNGGGQDAVSIEILNNFVAHPIQFAIQKQVYKNNFTTNLPLLIPGRKDAFTKPVYVLTSPQTGSAAETFALASMSMKNGKRIGAPSTGATSTALEKKLPNDWDFAISNEVLTDLQGNCYENIGVPVDFNLNYPRERQPFFRSIVNDLEKDKQAILQAIKILKEK